MVLRNKPCWCAYLYYNKDNDLQTDSDSLDRNAEVDDDKDDAKIEDKGKRSLKGKGLI